MHISALVADELRLAGHDAFQLRERRLERLEDFEILALAVTEDRVVVNFDLDFSALLAQSGASRPSIIQFHIEKTEAAVIFDWLEKIISLYAVQLDAGCILSVGTDRLRIRKLPLG